MATVTHEEKIAIDPELVDILTSSLGVPDTRVKPDAFLSQLGVEGIADIRDLIFRITQPQYYGEFFPIDERELIEALQEGYVIQSELKKREYSHMIVMDNEPVLFEEDPKVIAQQKERDDAEKKWQQTIARSVGRLQAYLNKVAIDAE